MLSQFYHLFKNLLLFPVVSVSGAWVGLFNIRYSLWGVSVILKSVIQAVWQLCNLIKRGDTCLKNLHLKTLLLARAAGSVCGTILWDKQAYCWFASLNFTGTSIPSWPGKTECQLEKNYHSVREERASALPEDSCYCRMGRTGAGTSDTASPTSPSFPGCHCGCLSKINHILLIKIIFLRVKVFWRCLLPVKSRKLHRKGTGKLSNQFWKLFILWF